MLYISYNFCYSSCSNFNEIAEAAPQELIVDEDEEGDSGIGID